MFGKAEIGRIMCPTCVESVTALTYTYDSLDIVYEKIQNELSLIRLWFDKNEVSSDWSLIILNSGVAVSTILDTSQLRDRYQYSVKT